MGDNNNLKIKVVDAMMGAGKSTAIMGYMEDRVMTDKFIYVTPFLPEVERFIDGCPSMLFKQPKAIGCSKRDNFMDLVRNGDNIVTTHATFGNLGMDDVEELRISGYKLIIDESVEAIKQYKIPTVHVKMMVKSGMCTVGDRNQVTWNHLDTPLSSIDDATVLSFAKLCDQHAVYLLNGIAFISEYPIDVLKAFDDVIVMTYLFEGTLMGTWCKMHNIEVIDFTSELNLHKSEAELKEQARKLLNIYKPKKDVPYSMSQNWFSKVKKEQMDVVKATCTSFVSNVKAKAEDILVTCPKANWDQQDKETGKTVKSGKLQAKGSKYTKATWLASNSRATNDYADKTAVIYMLSKNPVPTVASHIRNSGAEINEDKYALSEMLQFIWRGCIRKGEPMNVHVVCPRMRKLLIDWINS